MTAATEVTAERRSEAEQHLLDHALGEAARIGKLSRVREFVLGAQDGLLVPPGVVTGMAAANPSRSLIIVAGLAGEAEEKLYAAEIADEGKEIAEHFDREIAELAIVLEHEGLPRESAETVARGLAANPTVFLRTKVQKELGLSPDSGGAAFGDALMVGGTYMGAAVIPLWPYLLFQITPALVVSLACTLVALFALGVAKGRIARMALVRSGAQVLVIGAISAGIGFAVGHIVSAIAG